MAAPVGPKKVKRYSDEFKVQAVKLSLHPEIQTQDVAHAARQNADVSSHCRPPAVTMAALR
jgi:transposase-like protein